MRIHLTAEQLFEALDDYTRRTMGCGVRFGTMEDAGDGVNIEVHPKPLTRAVEGAIPGERYFLLSDRFGDKIAFGDSRVVFDAAVERIAPIMGYAVKEITGKILPGEEYRLPDHRHVLRCFVNPHPAE